MTRHAEVTGNINPTKGPNKKEIAIFLRALADGIEDGSLDAEGDPDEVRQDPMEGRWAKAMAVAGVSEERIKELEDFVITVDVTVARREVGLVEMLEEIFGKGSVVTEVHLLDNSAPQNAPSTDTPQ